MTLGAAAGNLFFQLVNARYERGAMILTSNRGFAEWGQVFGDPVIATALLDRLLHHAVVMHIESSSYRMRQHADLLPPVPPPGPRADVQPKRRGRPPKPLPTRCRLPDARTRPPPVQRYVTRRSCRKTCQQKQARCSPTRNARPDTAPAGRNRRDHHPLSPACRPPHPTAALARRRRRTARLAGRLRRLGRWPAGRPARHRHGRGAPGHRRAQPIRHRAATRIRSRLNRNEMGRFHSPFLGRIHPPLTFSAAMAVRASMERLIA